MSHGLIAVAGAGTMGNGIAHVFAQSGWSVCLFDTNEEQLTRAIQTIESNMDRQVKKGTLTEEQKKSALNHIVPVHRIEGFRDAEIVVEVIVENLDIKKAFFRNIDELLRPEAIFASNTSSISITKLAAATKRPDKVVGMHFMNPVPVMKLVEIIRGHDTSDATTGRIVEITKQLGKTPIEVNDYPGFVANRILMPMINEAIFSLWEGVATKEAIDEIMKLGMAHPMGPLALADFIGLDVCLSIMRVLRDGLGDDKYRPCPLLVKMVDAGYLGRKSGRGFYTYEGR